LFFLVYVAELILRFLADPKKAAKSGWVRFDIVVVFCQLVSLILDAIEESSDSAETKLVRQMNITRVLRLARLAKALRLMTAFKHLWKIIEGMINTTTTMMSITTILVIILYVFAVVGVEIIRMDEEILRDPSLEELVMEQFGNVPRTMMSLLQFVTMDAIVDIYFPLVVYNPSLIIYFTLIILVVSISMMNVAMAAVVQAAQDQTRKDKEVEDKQMREMLKQLEEPIAQCFEDMDQMGDGEISVEDLKKAIDDGAFQLPPQIADKVEPEELIALFDTLDTNGNGVINLEEFKTGINQIVITDVPVETTLIIQMLRSLAKDTNILVNGQGLLTEKVNRFIDFSV
jgi:hypothetical protein